MTFTESVCDKARKANKRIVLPEGLEPRTLKAANEALKEKIAGIVLVGNPDEIKREAEKNSFSYVIKNAEIIDPLNYSKKNDYVNLLYELRKSKGMTIEKAEELLKDPLYIGATMIKAGDVDGEVAGAKNATSDVLRPCLQIIKTKPDLSLVSGCFVMIVPDKNFGHDGIFIFADSGVTPDPDVIGLADIAIASADTCRQLVGCEPRVAMLSFSTKGSAKHPRVDKVIQATDLVKKKRPNLIVDGELQVDAAIIPDISKSKAPGNLVEGKANVLIFPDLDSGNIAYKIVQRLAHAEAFGPILQGINSPVNDLSRGCSYSDIVSTIAITAVQATGV